MVQGQVYLKGGGGLKLGQGLGALKKGGWNPFTNYATCEQTS